MLKKRVVFLLFSFLIVVSFPVLAQQKEQRSYKKEKRIEKKSKTKTSRKFRKYKTKEEKFEAAKMYYSKGSYLTASQLLEEIYPLYLGTEKGDSILFLFASSYYRNADYLIAAFYFNDFLRKYPQSPRAEDAAFYRAKAYYLNSPDYNLDQTDTYLAKENLEMFANYYPKGEHIEEVNVMLDSVRNKLALKDFSIAMMYYRTKNYKSAQIAFQNLMKDYADSKYVEEALFIMMKNNYEYAMKSVEAKKLERFQMVIDVKNKLKAKYPTSPYLAEAEKISNEVEKRMAKLIAEKK
ncbi:MAG TPA: outer membrane protein assembly factor BamD [Bacteroidales bacterium]|nr:outer membrane protein assembly factor BamD [Bacteroidales bacterium]HOR82584.1 outer membrane protein assembly factor BamD [Bacteroidales bacterium]HPJ91985.1 outer membrane protein assembly factor BamD [Bacteroidales bacterium]HPX59539.1 outer membrane protein assembly factor BamD [Bacteroidales bacterium]HQB19252.1 outer membrane protein assembly factor BamD [Bacteroidales bacterium]